MRWVFYFEESQACLSRSFVIINKFVFVTTSLCVNIRKGIKPTYGSGTVRLKKLRQSSNISIFQEKKMKKKLLALSMKSVLPLLCIASFSSRAQLVYHDVSPDASITVTVSSNDTIDLDNDGVKDFVLSLQHYTSGSNTYDVAIVIPASPNNAVDTIASAIPGFKTAVAHNYGDAINSSNKWVYGAALSYELLGGTVTGSSTGAGGAFLGQNDKYIAVRFKIGSNWHYGWIRISLNTTATLLTLKDWAYDATTDAPISSAGYVGIDEQSSALHDLSVFYSNQTIVLNFNNTHSVKATVQLTNALGQELYTREINSVSSSVSVDHFVPGIYFVTVVSGENKLTRKIIIQ